MRLLACIVVMFGLLFVSSTDAFAQAQRDNASLDYSKTVGKNGDCEALHKSSNTPGLVDDIMMSGGMICPCSPAPSVWIERIVSCFSLVPGGLIYESVGQIISSNKFNGFYNTLLYATILFAIVLFGLNLIMGSVQSIPKDSFTLILKIGAVMLFFNNYMQIYGWALEAVQDLAEIVGDAAGDIGNICETLHAGKSPTLWARWDCLFQKLTGLVGGYVGVGIVGFITAFLFSGGTGVAIFIATGYVIMTILLIAMRLVYSYLVAIMAVSFLFLLAPLFVPMIFFGQTYQKFATWFKIIIAYMVQPMILVLFMVLMLTALEFAIFVGPTSLFGALSNAPPGKPDESMTFSQVMNVHSGGGGLLPGIVTATTGSAGDWSAYVKQQQVFSFTEHTDPGVNTSNASHPDAADMTGSNTGPFGNQPSVNPNAPTNPEGSHEGGFKVPKIDYDGIAGHLGIDKTTWVENIILQLTACAVLVFILYNLVHAVPQITHDLIAQRFGAGFGSATKARMVGESEIRKSVDGGKEIARRGKETGDHDEAVRGVLKEAYDSAVSNRGGGGG